MRDADVNKHDTCFLPQHSAVGIRNQVPPPTHSTGEPGLLEVWLSALAFYHRIGLRENLQETVVFCSTIKYTECSGSFTLNQTNDSELNEELLEALCQKTKLFCGPWGRLLLQYPQTPSTDQKISEIIEVSGFLL